MHAAYEQSPPKKAKLDAPSKPGDLLGYYLDFTPSQTGPSTSSDLALEGGDSDVDSELSEVEEDEEVEQDYDDQSVHVELEEEMQDESLL